MQARMAHRFRGFLPVVVDVETGGVDAAREALLQVAAVVVEMDPDGRLVRGATHSYHVKPFEGANIEPASLQVNRIDPWHPLGPAIDEREALQRIFKDVRAAMAEAGCKRTVLVGHNASFDLGFLNAAIERTGIKRSPFHPFSCFDTATLAGAAYGQTVLAKASTIAGFGWDSGSAHSATYDAERTADLFCAVCNTLAASFMRANDRARELGWFESPGSGEPETEAAASGGGAEGSG